jgi:hypothetical protein
MGDSMITAIIKILTTPKATAELCLSIFGEGTANPEASQIENYLAYCMTPVQNGYARVLIGKKYSDALQYLQDEYESTDVEVVLIEPDGQTMFQVGTSLEGDPEYLGLFAGAPMYHEEVING